MAETRPRFCWPPGWELVTRDGRLWVTCLGGCTEDRGYKHKLGPVVALPDDVVEASCPGSDSLHYQKPDGGLTPEWIIQQDAETLKRAVTVYCDHLEAFEAAGVAAETRADEEISNEPST